MINETSQAIEDLNKELTEKEKAYGEATRKFEQETVRREEAQRKRTTEIASKKEILINKLEAETKTLSAGSNTGEESENQKTGEKPEAQGHNSTEEIEKNISDAKTRHKSELTDAVKSLDQEIADLKNEHLTLLPPLTGRIDVDIDRQQGVDEKENPLIKDVDRKELESRNEEPEGGKVEEPEVEQKTTKKLLEETRRLIEISQNIIELRSAKAKATYKKKQTQEEELGKLYSLKLTAAKASLDQKQVEGRELSSKLEDAAREARLGVAKNLMQEAGAIEVEGDLDKAASDINQIEEKIRFELEARSKDDDSIRASIDKIESEIGAQELRKIQINSELESLKRKLDIESTYHQDTENAYGDRNNSSESLNTLVSRHIKNKVRGNGSKAMIDECNDVVRLVAEKRDVAAASKSPVVAKRTALAKGERQEQGEIDETLQKLRAAKTKLEERQKLAMKDRKDYSETISWVETNVLDKETAAVNKSLAIEIVVEKPKNVTPVVTAKETELVAPDRGEIETLEVDKEAAERRLEQAKEAAERLEQQKQKQEKQAKEAAERLEQQKQAEVAERLEQEEEQEEVPLGDEILDRTNEQTPPDDSSNRKNRDWRPLVLAMSGSVCALASDITFLAALGDVIPDTGNLRSACAAFLILGVALCAASLAWESTKSSKEPPPTALDLKSSQETERDQVTEREP